MRVASSFAAAMVLAPRARAASMNISSFSNVSAWSGLLETSRRAMHDSPVGASKVVAMAKGAVRLMKVYSERR